jgi:hypothetical protein
MIQSMSRSKSDLVNAAKARANKAAKAAASAQATRLKESSTDPCRANPAPMSVVLCFRNSCLQLIRDFVHNLKVSGKYGRVAASCVTMLIRSCCRDYG